MTKHPGRLISYGLAAALAAPIGFVACLKGTIEVEETTSGKIETFVTDAKPIGERYVVRLPADCKEVLDKDAYFEKGESQGYIFYAKCRDQKGDIAVYISAPDYRAWDKITFVPTGAEDTRTLDKRIMGGSDSYIKQIEDSDKKPREDNPELYKR